ncbi:NAD(P)/FAD-dependent oxidoreductase [Edaphobacillus lindanitolerans]|uniref:Glycine/D-amino acid oxidase n=1 Tax=Edaphobacillus lindanitolerans TaxID=550447 RepID=A0A1U7PJW3_9BACI|nr:FAD-dependent oxidoreductase [Edaphobacillus lindanitolerans]SIT71485.1 Glycine/D-amino acid oxidase [Edaphobacillus lindanitolerans]
MELHEGSLFWPGTVKDDRPFGEKEPDGRVYGAAVIGGGMSGAISAAVLSGEGLDVALIDGRAIGAGSTSANTGLLQYSNDIMLHELADQIGWEKAVRFYRGCAEAMDGLGQLAEKMDLDSSYISRSSLYYASREDDREKVRCEYEALRKNGFRADYWDEPEIGHRFPFQKPCAIVTHGDAEVNPLAYCRGAARLAERRGADIFEETKVAGLARVEGLIQIRTGRGTILAERVVLATGYSHTLLADHSVKNLNRTFAIATEPVNDLSFWHDHMMIWETKRPYLYARTTADNRIIIGGLDQETVSMPQSIERIREKGIRLESALAGLFPDLDVDVSHIWTAVFGESDDNLPMIGRHPEEKDVYYLLGLGGNGTVYSMMGAGVIADLMRGKESLLSDIVDPAGRARFWRMADREE